MTSGGIPERARRRGRAVLVVFGVAVVLMLAVPRLMTWWRAGELCPSEITAHGRSPRGIDWTITKSDCGAAVGEVWQVRLIAPGGVSQPVYDARGGPKALAVEQTAEDMVRIVLDRPPEGAAEPEVSVHIDYKARPSNPARFVDGKAAK